ncbi:phosphoglycerate mutase family protein [Aquimarina hainanensis]|uniref:Phosphoglycerate mutase family protein n=1 Tax=Aquimarina hainanensis TaxID=1578017 RepID=A0ABW5NDF4_9FLAO
MKHICIFLFSILIIGCSSPTTSTTSETTTYFLIRHAEKDLSDPRNPNPMLTEKGNIRAKKWAAILAPSSIDYVYSTQFLRTKLTATPIAQKNKVPITTYAPNKLLSKDFKQKTKGKTTVIIGHSNTIPSFINTLLQKKKYDDLEHEDYGKLFIIKITGDQITETVLDIN